MCVKFIVFLLFIVLSKAIDKTHWQGIQVWYTYSETKVQFTKTARNLLVNVYKQN